MYNSQQNIARISFVVSTTRQCYQVKEAYNCSVVHIQITKLLINNHLSKNQSISLWFQFISLRTNFYFNIQSFTKRRSSCNISKEI